MSPFPSDAETPGARLAERNVGLFALLDFLLGSTIDDVAARCRISRAKTEDCLRRVLLDYGFDAHDADA